MLGPHLHPPVLSQELILNGVQVQCSVDLKQLSERRGSERHRETLQVSCSHICVLQGVLTLDCLISIYFHLALWFIFLS